MGNAGRVNGREFSIVGISGPKFSFCKQTWFPCCDSRTAGSESVLATRCIIQIGVLARLVSGRRVLATIDGPMVRLFPPGGTSGTLLLQTIATLAKLLLSLSLISS